MKDHDRAKLEAELEFSWTGNLGRWNWHFPSGRVVFNPRKVVERDEAKSPVRITGIVFDISTEIIAHNLRSPISSLVSFIRLMQDERFCPEEESFRDMLETVIRNLVSNAVKFSPPGGKVSTFYFTLPVSTIPEQVAAS